MPSITGIISAEEAAAFDAAVIKALGDMPRTVAPESPTPGTVYRDFKGDYHIFLPPTWRPFMIPLLTDIAAVKSAMKHRRAQSCATCGNARNNPGMGGPGDGFLECNANVLARFKVERTEVCDHFNGAHGPTEMPR